MFWRKRAIRIINNSDYNNDKDPLFTNYAFFKWSAIYNFQTSLFVVDFISRKLPHSFDNRFRIYSDVTLRYLLNWLNLNLILNGIAEIALFQLVNQDHKVR